MAAARRTRRRARVSRGRTRRSPRGGRRATGRVCTRRRRAFGPSLGGRTPRPFRSSARSPGRSRSPGPGTGPGPGPGPSPGPTRPARILDARRRRRTPGGRTDRTARRGGRRAVATRRRRAARPVRSVVLAPIVAVPPDPVVFLCRKIFEPWFGPVLGPTQPSPPDASSQPPRAPARNRATALGVHDDAAPLDRPPVRAAVRGFHVILPGVLHERVPAVARRFIFIIGVLSGVPYHRNRHRPHVPERLELAPQRVFVGVVRQPTDEQRLVRVGVLRDVHVRLGVVRFRLCTQLRRVPLLLLTRDACQTRVPGFQADGDARGGLGGFLVAAFRILELADERGDARQRQGLLRPRGGGHVLQRWPGLEQSQQIRG